MARVATIPAAADLLCEGCGYVLNGLPADGRCPECGKPLAESAAALRQPPAWDRGREAGNGLVRFLHTTASSTFRPAAFFRGLSLNPSQASFYFAQLHWLLASALFGAAAWAHMQWSAFLFGGTSGLAYWLSLVATIGLTYVGTVILNRLAARLSAWEAGYRGIRLPLDVVRRGLHYHAAHYFPVALLTATIVFGFQILLHLYPQIAGLQSMTYLYVLCGSVILSAIYLFKTYWIAMRNLMYGNRQFEEVRR